MNSVQALSSFFQSMPLFKGKRRLGRLSLKLTGIQKRKNISITTKAGKFHLPNLLDMISIDLFLNGHYEKGLVDFLVRNIPRSGVFVDVGANIGSISIPVSAARPDVKIVCIEASPWIFKILSENVAANGATNITLLNNAAYSESGKQLPMYAPKDLFGKGSLRSVYTKEAEMVETITIDDIKNTLRLPAVHFIKVDVEGFEASVFRGMPQVSRIDRPKVIFEFSEWAEIAAGFKACDAQSEILSRGYSIQEMDNDFHLVGQPANKVFNVKSANLFAS